MAHDHDNQFQTTSLCSSSSSSNWWNTTRSKTGPIAGFDNYPSSFSCSTDQLMTNFTGNSSFSWPSSAANDVFDAKSTRSCDESPGSVSDSSIILNDIPQYSSDPMLDFSLLSPTMSWSQPFLTSDQTTGNNLHGLLQQDTMISETNQMQNNFMGNSSLNQGLLQDGQHSRNSARYMNSDNSNMGFLPSEQVLHGMLQPSYNKVQETFHEPQNGSTSNYLNNFHGRMDMQSQAVMNKVQQLVKGSGSKQQLQLSNSTAFWNPLDSTAARMNMFHSNSMPNKLLQNDHSSVSTNLGAKPYFGVNNPNSTSNKRIENEPALKKPRMQTPSPVPTFKVRKEKLGDRVTALQQLVSPFGKTDTASVLHEAIDYIKFLHDQVRTLSAPYLKNGQQMQQVKSVDQHKDSEGNKQDLRSRGLCLVPISSTYPVGTETPIDFWTPPFGGSYMQ